MKKEDLFVILSVLLVIISVFALGIFGLRIGFLIQPGSFLHYVLLPLAGVFLGWVTSLYLGVPWLDKLILGK